MPEQVNQIRKSKNRLHKNHGKEGVKMAISISTGSIRFGSESKNGLVSFAEDNFKNLIDGIELCFILKEEFTEFKLSIQSAKFLNSLQFNTLHAPVKGLEYGKNKESQLTLKKISEIGKRINLNYVTFHPNHVTDFSVLAESGLNVCIENLPDGKTRKGWQFPKEFKKFFKKWPQIGLCLDVNHAMANGVELAEFTLAFKDRIRYIHLNATANAGNADHALLVESSEETIEKIKPVFKLQKPLVIEVNIEKQKISLIKNEVHLIRKLANQKGA